MVIGLTGRSCSGKDTVAEILDKNRFEIIDEDKLGHLALEKNIGEVVDAFGESVIVNGKIDRKTLSKIVFSDERALRKLESITHPWMKEETKRKIDSITENGKIAVINAALLERMKLTDLCTEIWIVLSPYEKRLERALKRDGVTEESFKKRTLSQQDIGSTVYSLKKPVFTVINDSSKEVLCRQVELYCDRM